MCTKPVVVQVYIDTVTISHLAWIELLGADRYRQAFTCRKKRHEFIVGNINSLDQLWQLHHTRKLEFRVSNTVLVEVERNKDIEEKLRQLRIFGSLRKISYVYPSMDGSRLMDGTGLMLGKLPHPDLVTYAKKKYAHDDNWYEKRKNYDLLHLDSLLFAVSEGEVDYFLTMDKARIDQIKSLPTRYSQQLQQRVVYPRKLLRLLKRPGMK